MRPSFGFHNKNFLQYYWVHEKITDHQPEDKMSNRLAINWHFVTQNYYIRPTETAHIVTMESNL